MLLNTCNLARATTHMLLSTCNYTHANTYMQLRIYNYTVLWWPVIIWSHFEQQNIWNLLHTAKKQEIFFILVVLTLSCSNIRIVVLHKERKQYVYMDQTFVSIKYAQVQLNNPPFVIILYYYHMRHLTWLRLLYWFTTQTSNLYYLSYLTWFCTQVLALLQWPLTVKVTWQLILHEGVAGSGMDEWLLNICVSTYIQGIF